MNTLGVHHKDLFQIVAGWVGNALALFFFFSPAVIIYNMMKKKIETESIPYLLLIANILNCLFWFIYGVRKDDLQVYFCNSIGAIINVIYLMIYWYYLVEGNLFKYARIVSIGLIFIIGVFYFFMFTVRNFEVVGYVAMIFNIIMYAAPGQKLLQVIQTGNYILIPIVSSVIGLLCSTSWLIYAIYDHNIQIMIPNALGIIFSIIQIGVWLHFYTKSLQEVPEFSPYVKYIDEDGKSM